MDWNHAIVALLMVIFTMLGVIVGVTLLWDLFTNG